MDVSSAIGWLFISLVVFLPLVVGIFTGYEASASLTESARHCLGAASRGSIVIAILNLGRVGLKFDQWYWETLLVIPIFCAVQLTIDWLVIRHDPARRTI